MLRLLGIAAIMAGAAVILTTDLEDDDVLLGAVSGAAICLVGIAFMAGRPFRPDLGDVSYTLNPFGNAEPRRWFTGDRKAERG
jgi:drug/metabolite transporter (DMT)-like permease